MHYFAKKVSWELYLARSHNQELAIGAAMGRDLSDSELNAGSYVIWCKSP
jgi:hypothetical protein